MNVGRKASTSRSWADGVVRRHALVVVDAQLGVGRDLLAEALHAPEVLGVAGEPGLHLEQPQPLAVEPLHHVHVTVEVGVGDREGERDVVAAAAAQQLGHRQAAGLADDVEQRHLHRRLGFGLADHGVVRRLEQRRDARGVGAQ